MKDYPETHQQGFISIENLPDELRQAGFDLDGNEAVYVRPGMFKGDFGIQVAKDGRVWVCINGIAFIRFKPDDKGGK